MGIEVERLYLYVCKIPFLKSIYDRSITRQLEILYFDWLLVVIRTCNQYVMSKIDVHKDFIEHFD